MGGDIEEIIHDIRGRKLAVYIGVELLPGYLHFKSSVFTGKNLLHGGDIFQGLQGLFEFIVRHRVILSLCSQKEKINKYPWHTLPGSGQ